MALDFAQPFTDMANYDDAADQLPSQPRQQWQLTELDTLRQARITGPVAVPAFALSSVLSLAETFATSMIPDSLLPDDALEEFLTKHGGSFGEFFTRTRGGSQAVGDIAGIFIPATLATKVIRSKQWFDKLQKIPGVSKTVARNLWSTGQSNQALFARSFQQAYAIGKKSRANSTALAPAMAAKKAKNLKRSIYDTFIEGVAQDLTIAATMHSSDFLFPEEMSTADNFKFIGGANAVVDLAAAGIAHRAWQKGIAAAWGAGRGEAKTFADTLIQEAGVNRVGHRGIRMAAAATFLQQADSLHASADAAGQTLETTVAKAEQTAATADISRITDRIFTDNPYPGITQTATIRHIENAPELQTVLAANRVDPNLGIGLKSFEHLTDERIPDVLSAQSRRVQKLREEYAKTSELYKRAAKREESKLRKPRSTLLANKLDKLQQEGLEIKGLTPQVIELDGTTTVGATRAPIFQDGERSLRSFGDLETGLISGDSMFVARADGRVVKQPKQQDVSFDIAADGSLTGDVLPMTPEFWASLSHMERTGIQDAAQKTLERLNPETWAGAVIDPETVHFTQLDFLIEAGTNNPGLMAKIIGGGSLEDLQYLSIIKKFDAFQDLRAQMINNPKSASSSIYQTLDNRMVALNLPRRDSPMALFFERQAALLGEEKLPLSTIVRNLSEVEQGIKSVLELAPEAPIQLETAGNMLKLPRDRKPVLAIHQNTDFRSARTTEDLIMRAAQAKAEQHEILTTGAAHAPLIAVALAELARRAPVIKAAREALWSTVEGTKISTGIGDFISQQSHRYREIPAYKSFDLATSMMDAANKKGIQTFLQSPTKHNAAMTYQQTFDQILLRESEADLDYAQNAIRVLRQGWDIHPTTPFREIKGPKGETQFQMLLKGASARNKALYEKLNPGQDISGESKNSRFNHRWNRDADCPHAESEGCFILN